MGNLSLVGGSNQGISTKVDSQRSINWMPVKPERQGDQAHLRGRPGLLTHCTVPRTKHRGVLDYKGRPFCVTGSRIYEIRENGDVVEWGRIASVEGKVTMASLLNVIVIGDGAAFYALDLDTGLVSTITDAPRGRFCVFFKQRIIYQGENGQFFYSELNDPTNIPGLNFATAESLPDEIVAISTSEDQLLLHGIDSTEPWYSTGDSDNPFAPVPGGIMYSGCAFPDTALRLDNSAWWVEKDKDGQSIVRRTEGATPMRVSTSAVERWIGRQSNVAAHTYQEEGRLFLRLTADEGPNWTYSLREQEWFEEAWLNRNTGEQERQRPEFHVHAFGYNLVFDYENGKVYRQGLAYHSDDGQEIRSTRVTGYAGQDGKQTTIWELYLNFAAGVGLDGSGQGTDPEVMLRVSKDGGSWGMERRAKLGGIGKYRQRVRFHRLGTGTDFRLEISVSDPVLKCLMDGDVVLTPGRR